MTNPNPVSPQSDTDKTPRILFICLGNICRSPTAEAVFKVRARRAGLDVEVDSAGTSGWHVGETPDPRSIEAGEARGYSFAGQNSRAVSKNDFVLFDKIIAMDRQNLEALTEICPERYTDKLEMFLNYAPDTGVTNVPDPYYGSGDGFKTVLDLIETASDGLIQSLQTPETE